MLRSLRGRQARQLGVYDLCRRGKGLHSECERFDITMIWIPFRLILMGGQVIDRGRTESGVVRATVNSSKSCSYCKAFFSHYFSWIRIKRRCFCYNRSCTLALLFIGSRHFGGPGFTAVRPSILFLVFCLMLAKCVHALGAFFEHQSCAQELNFLTNRKYVRFSGAVRLWR